MFISFNKTVNYNTTRYAFAARYELHDAYLRTITELRLNFHSPYYLL